MSKRKILKQQCKEIIQLNPTERVWQMPFFFALAVGFALSIAAYYDRMDLGLIAIIGIMAFVYTTNTPMHHRMAVTMCCSFGLCLSFLIGLCTHFFPAFSPLVVGLVAMASSILIRYYNIGAPGYFFFVFSCLLASFFPFPPKDYIFLVGLICIGGIIANITAFLYSVSVIYIFKNSPPKPVLKNGNLGFDVIFVDSIIIAFFVGFAVFLGTFLELDRSYWVAVSTTVILQGTNLNSVWIKQLQRILGTTVGILFAWWLLRIKFTPLEFIFLMMFLAFIIEFLVVRNYALAVIFLTPYVTYLAEAASFGNLSVDMLIHARLQDIIIGSLLGLLGGFVIHRAYLRKYFEYIAKYIFRVKLTSK
ncbi:FUSC family protein [Campylobacter coli]|nr:FUSC family protein [Campylobacter coli]